MSKNPMFENRSDAELIEDLQEVLKIVDFTNNMLGLGIVHYGIDGDPEMKPRNVDELLKDSQRLCAFIQAELEARGIHACQMGADTDGQPLS